MPRSDGSASVQSTHALGTSIAASSPSAQQVRTWGFWAKSWQLRAILAYHVVPGTVMAADIADGQTATTVQGAPIIFSTADGVRVNGATVVQPDLAVSKR